MTYHEWFAAATKLYNSGTDHCQRLGQFFMNHLYSVRPDLYKLVSKQYETGNNKIDPFFTDKNFASFLIFVMENWEEK